MGTEMKKILLIFITVFIVEAIHELPLRCGGLYAQNKKGKIEGIIYLANDQTVAMNAHVVSWIAERLDSIASIEGKTILLIPVEKQFKKRLRTRMIDGYMVQYAYTGIDVSLQKPKTKYLEFDFDKKTIKEKNANDDNDDPWKPSDSKLKDKIKEKDNKDKPKPTR